MSRAAGHFPPCFQASVREGFDERFVARREIDLVPLFLADQEVGLGNFGDPADVIEVQVGDDDGADVGQPGR